MPIIIMLEDHTGNFSRQARMDEKATIANLIPAIITALKLPIMDNAGRPITYHLSHGGRRLQEAETLATAEVQQGDTLTIVPEMTAGSSSESSLWKAEPSLVELGTTVHRKLPIAGFPHTHYKIEAAGTSIQVALTALAWKQIWRQAQATIRCEIGGLLLGRVYEEHGQHLALVVDPINSEWGFFSWERGKIEPCHPC